ncbi:long-chain fatty aldehyde decarbonylase [Adhaeribacter radiodurans]|uniref:Long-chain fatty aldehyde decarbonylase n=1 Tax=Adhaeribacter radiodurans TaxID=2745197 RepID=A0A7L7L5S7_9BACT|nr:long-chain fatty aldehyde decarbonylase [Adhaeribacter radiodurans]QMU28171.1 long-chain fatty aldehyde decarbonylase [Adhaeribacter radiodurans]
MEKPLLSEPIAAEQQAVITDILSQAITGELIGMSNFASLAGAIDDVHEKMEAVEHANCERNHAEGFIAVAKQFGLQPIINMEGYYWKNVRDCFLKYAKQKDCIGCIIIQEVMLECFAVSMYHDVGQVLDNEIGALFRAISAEEEEHIEHSINLLQAEMNKDSFAFYQKVEAIHWDCMGILAEWTAQTDLKGHCGVCKGTCMKESLPNVSLDVTTMRGNALNLYMKTLDRIGLPGEKTLQWVINLPA